MCSNTLRISAILDFFDTNCKNKKGCKIDFKKDEFWESNAPTVCRDGKSFVFVQYGCEMTQD